MASCTPARGRAARAPLLAGLAHVPGAARAQVGPLWQRAKELLPPMERIAWADEALQALRWMIEGLRVSLFAQQLGTRRPVSPKKVERQLRTARRGQGARGSPPSRTIDSRTRGCHGRRP